ncbi:hydroxysteroid dehydrogenase-like protein 2 [Diaphorina citri]|uniref:Hydroxysteroid dehydrogenase-like protein 2 n=1 Tax=Diaphorina citri TaxID=121845 RepID=A0A1S3DAM9_DIACI|nr:hydroxysteroid dehydrogenase-like protein 2 [Diaphorina citri]
MINTGKLSGLTIFITGASRGIGKAIALKAAKDGANIVIAAKTAEPHPKLPGTIYSAAKEVEDAGGRSSWGSKCFSLDTLDALLSFQVITLKSYLSVILTPYT